MSLLQAHLTVDSLTHARYTETEILVFFSKNFYAEVNQFEKKIYFFFVKIKTFW